MLDTPELDWKPILDEAIGHLQSLLRIDTTNPPGNEAAAARYLESVLHQEGIPFETVDSAPGRSNVVARLAGGNPSGAVILSSHLDVVPAEPSRWTHPPFGGEIHDGYIWGRGAIDMKSMTVMSLMTVILLKRLGRTLSRDVVFAALADEEGGMDFGSAWLVERRPDLLEGEYCLTEGGGATGFLGGKRVYSIQCAAKGVAWLRLTATGSSGHGSLPHGDNAVVRMGRILARLGERSLPCRIVPPVSAYLSCLANVAGWPKAFWLHIAAIPGLRDWALERGNFGDRTRVLKALIRNTVTPTGLVSPGGGVKENVIPSSATAILDARYLPGTRVDDLLDQVRAVAQEPVEIEVIRTLGPVEQSHETPLFCVLAQVLEERDPGCHVVPGVLAGLTDATHLTRLGLTTYGFAPLKVPPDLPFNRLFHGDDERIPVEGFCWGLQTLFQAVSRFCVSGPDGNRF